MVKHRPQRTCVVCRSSDDKYNLIRLVRTPAGIEIDPGGKMEGRGAYLCRNLACWERAIHSDVLGKALKVTITDEDRERLYLAKPTS